MFKKIDKLQSEVDELLELCAEAGALDDLEALGTVTKKQQRLGMMILRMQDGDLEPRSIHRLGTWLNCDEEAMRYYIDFQELTAALVMSFQ